MSDSLITIGNFSIKWYSVLIVFSVIISIIFIVKEAKKFKIDKDFLINLLFWTILFGIIGARVYYCIFNFEYFSNNIIDVFKIWEGGLAIHGALIAGAATILIYCKKYKVPSLLIFDIMVPFLLLSQAIGRWGNFFNQEAYGSLTTIDTLHKLFIPDFIIYGMNINGAYYLPMFYFESLWCLLGVIVLLVIRKLKYTKIGVQFGVYLMWYSFGRFFIEYFRTDSLMFGYFKVAQIISLILFILGLIILLIQYRKPKLDNLYREYKEIDVKHFK
ncbi:MAG: prolipoprotein diacylglyceryl transferase [Bacilli bacterium]